MSKPNRLSWLPFLAEPVPEDLTEPAQVAAFELAQVTGLRAVLAPDPAMGEAYELVPGPDGVTVRGGKAGILYGAYALLTAHALGQPLPAGVR